MQAIRDRAAIAVGIVAAVKGWFGDRRTVGSVLLLIGGTAGAQAINLAAAPVVTRLYAPSDFGLLAVFAGILSVLVSIASLRYELAISIENDRINAASLVVLSLGLVAVCAIVTAIGLFMVPDAIGRVFGIPDVGSYLWLVPVGLLFVGSYQVLNYWAIREEQYGVIAKTRVIQSVTHVGTQIGLGLVSSGPLGLVVGDIVGRAGGATALGSLAWSATIAAVRRMTRRSLWLLATRYRRFPLIASGATLINNLGIYVPPLMIASLFGADAAGWLALCQRTVGVPLTIVGSAAAQVFLGNAARLKRENPRGLAHLLVFAAIRLLVIGTTIIGGVALVGPTVFDVVFGSGWGEAGQYARYLSMMYVAQFVVVPLSQTLYVVERQELQFAWDVCRLVLTAGSVLLASRLGWSAREAILAFAITMTASYVVLYVIIHVTVTSSTSRERTEVGGRVVMSVRNAD